MDSNGVKEYKVMLKCDTSEAKAQIDELNQLLSLRFPDGIHDQFISDFSEFSKDIVLTDDGSTVTADGTIEVLQRLRFGPSFERFMTTIRTAKAELSHD
jgi:phosphotransferase system HPr-like phosphotransfer protein